jgi:hypothetical protein
MFECCAYCVVCCVSGFKLLDRIASSRAFGALVSKCIFPGIIVLETIFYFTAILPVLVVTFGAMHAAWITSFGLLVCVNIAIALILAQFMGKFNYVMLEDLPKVMENECSKCGANRPEQLRIHHCSTCNRCVLRHDHHCRNFKLIFL